MSNTEITPFGFDISEDSNGMVSLTDIWKEAGNDPQKTPSKWQETESCKAFLRAACRMLNIANNDIIKSTRGKGGGTKAHKHVAIEYAQYLDPRIAVALNQIFFERVEEEKNPELAIERAKGTWRRKGKSEKWISMRMACLEERKSFTHTLKEHGVSGIGYKDCTNAIYKPLWGGGAELVRAKKNLPEGSNCRDFMTEIELAGVRLAELLAEENIEKNNAKGNKEAAFYCEKASRSIAVAIIQNNGGKKI